ncbi:MAG: hypothetical protein IH602_17340 [Bryobacteraceae bacterium]|nr:hypothetical protein [Bryobacteraceae bacterium]
MRRLKFMYLLALAPLAGCKKYRRPNPSATIEEPAELATMVSMGEPKDESQILSGFGQIESSAWRWTERKFSVSLGTPLAGRVKGAKLELKCAVADVIAAQLLPLTVSVKLNGRALEPQRLTVAGQQTVLFPVPKEALGEGAVVAEFELDKAARQGEDAREFGLIAVSIGFIEP